MGFRAYVEARYGNGSVRPKKLERLAGTLGLFQRDIAEAADLSRATVCHAFAGRPIGVRSARAIAAVLGSRVPLLVPDSDLKAFAKLRVSDQPSSGRCAKAVAV